MIMRAIQHLLLALGLATLTVSLAAADTFTFEDFIGTWEGQSSSDNYAEWNTAMTLEVEPDGFYTDSSGLLMPPYYYPDTQLCEYEADTNRVHFWYLDTVYAGMHFYQHFFYEVAVYTGDYLELHYNYWDDSEAHPNVQTIALNRAGATDVEDSSEVPVGIHRLSNFPNPFNPSTTLEFSIAQDSYVSLKVYNLRGQEVATLADGAMSIGLHRFEWKATGLPSGVYMAKLRAGDLIETRRLTLIK